MALKELIEAEQRLIEDLRGQAQVLETRGRSGDKEAAEALLLKINAMQNKLDGLKARQGGREPVDLSEPVASLQEPLQKSWPPQRAILAAVLAAAAGILFILAKLFGWID
jgi:hypothetical protein